jgi:hypothetical protein
MKFQQLLKRLRATARKNNRKDVMIKKFMETILFEISVIAAGLAILTIAGIINW